MAKLHIKKGDNVMVIAGNDKGVSGRVLEVIVEKTKPSSKVLIWYQNIPNLMPNIRMEALLKKKPPFMFPTLNLSIKPVTLQG
jgi:large subunit ribosomal protein L24